MEVSGINSLTFNKKPNLQNLGEKIESIFWYYLIKELNLLDKSYEPLKPIVEFALSDELSKRTNLGIKEIFIKQIDKEFYKNDDK